MESPYNFLILFRNRQQFMSVELELRHREKTNDCVSVVLAIRLSGLVSTGLSNTNTNAIRHWILQTAELRPPDDRPLGDWWPLS